MVFTVNKIQAHKSAGNVLFIILIAVALFAALSYALTQSNRGGGTSIKNEKDTVDAGIVSDCEARTKMSITRLKITNGCTQDQISYELPGGYNANAQAPADQHCHLFHPNGAGATPCGAYTTITSVPTGTIVRNNTATVSRMASGVYFKCNSWSGVYCNLGYSPTGLSFTDAGNTCITKADGTGRTDTMIAFSLGAAICSAACGGSALYFQTNTSGTAMSYLEDDLTLTPWTGACSYSIPRVGCSCW